MKCDTHGRRAFLRLTTTRSRADLSRSLAHIGVLVTPQWLGQIVAGNEEPSLRLAFGIQRRFGIPAESWLTPAHTKNESILSVTSGKTENEDGDHAADDRDEADDPHAA